MHGTGKHLRRAWFVSLAALSLIAGCAGRPKPRPSVATTQPTSVDLRITPTGETGVMPPLIHLDVYEIEAPAGDLSSNSAFWSMVHAGTMDAGAVARLKQNGLRCGLAARDQWPRFRALLDALPCRVRKLSVNGQDAPALSLDLSQDLDSEDLFYVGPAGQVEGRSFQSCTNFVSLGFQPIDGDRAVRIALTPVVRSRRDRINFTPLNHEYDSPFQSNDRLFDIDLHADVPTSSFMVVGPTGGAMHPTSIGGSFFADRSGAELREQVLIIVPTYLKVDGQKFTLLQMSDRK